MKPVVKKIGVIAGATFIVALSFFAGLYVNAEKAAHFGSVADLYQTDPTMVGAPSGVDFSDFWKAWNVINSEYVPTGVAATTTVTDEDKVYGAIKGMADSLGDPYTTFFSPDEAKDFTTDLSGSLEGIGAVLSIQNNALTVMSVIKSSPAEKDGLLPADQIVKIDGTPTLGMDIDTAVMKIRGKKGTSVELLVHRAGKPDLTMMIIRDTITTPVVEGKQYPNGTYVITVGSFTSNAPDLFRTALRDFVNSGSTKLVIDLRNNTGGYLDAAVDMASWFLPAGKTVVTEDYGSKSAPTIYASKGYDLFSPTMKVVILVNEDTASASEIFAGALHDYGKAVLVGEKTYGKGSVQELVPITDDTILKVTVARWLTPLGASISLNGITPDYVVDLTPDDVKAGKDPQLTKALQLAAQN